DKATGDAPVAGNEHALRKVGETEHGILVRGARVLATLAPFADELAVYPAAPLPQGADAYALSFCIPMNAPGLKFLCRDSVSRGGTTGAVHDDDRYVTNAKANPRRARSTTHCTPMTPHTVTPTSATQNRHKAAMSGAWANPLSAWAVALQKNR